MKKEQVKNKAAFNVTFNYNVVPENPVQSVVVLGDFNEWSHENAYVLKQNKKGDFEGKFTIPAGRNYHFRYLVNGERWANEKDADGWESSPLHPHIDNSVLSLPSVSIEEPKKAASAVKPSTDGDAPAKKATKAAPEKKAAPAKKAEAKPAAKKAAVQKVTKDDLTKIEGIGPKIAELLNKGGIVSFDDLAKSKKGTLSEILEAAGSRYAMHDPKTWAQQAKLAASGKWEQLATLQDELKGGK
jgi:predicted flap endonuclease-1-like 5' DNA nuclease